MMTLSEVNILKSIFGEIEKSHKYIRREWRNGRWRYWYEDVRGKIVEGKYGKILKNFVGDPRQAFKALFRAKTGQAYNVVKLQLPAIDVGQDGKPYQVYQVGGEPLMVETSIDMVWGNVKKGLKHILLRHFVEQDDFESIGEVENVLTYNLVKFQKNPTSFKVKFNEKTGTYEIRNLKGEVFIVDVEVSKDIYGNPTVRHFILSSYDISREKKSKEIKDKNIRSMRYEKINQTKY